MDKKKLILIIILILVALLVIFVLWRILGSRQVFEKKELIEKQETASDFIKLTQPQPGAGINSPFTIVGRAKTIDNLVNLSIQDEVGKILFEKKIELSNLDSQGFGNFETKVNYLLGMPKSPNITLTAQGKGRSPVLGETVYSVSTPLLYQLGQNQVFKIFFTNERLNLEKKCGNVFSVERVILDAANAPKQAIEILLSGPTNQEKNVDYSSAIPEGTKLLNFKIENETAKLEFDQSIKLEDFCQTKNIQQQIIETLKQFPEIKDISVNGEILK